MVDLLHSLAVLACVVFVVAILSGTAIILVFDRGGMPEKQPYYKKAMFCLGVAGLSTLVALLLEGAAQVVGFF